MATFLLCMRPIPLKEIERHGIIFNLLLVTFGLNTPKTIFYEDKIISHLNNISRYENILVNIQIYSPSLLGIEITNVKKQDYFLVIAISDEGMELGYAHHRYERIKKLEIEEDYDVFISKKLEEINKI